MDISNFILKCYSRNKQTNNRDSLKGVRNSVCKITVLDVILLVSAPTTKSGILMVGEFQTIPTS
jgi:hypothetical protein